MRRSRIPGILSVILAMVIIASCSGGQRKPTGTVEHYVDKPFTQDYSIKYVIDTGDIRLFKVVSDRNGYIQILSSKGLLRTRDGQFLFPGQLVKDVQDRQTSDKKIASVSVYRDQLVYLDDKAVLSNAWAG